MNPTRDAAAYAAQLHDKTSRLRALLAPFTAPEPEVFTSPAEHDRLRARLLDRLGQLVPRLAASESETSSDGFTEVRVELSALALQRELPHLNPSQREAVEAVLTDVVRFYRARLDEQVSEPGAPLHDKLLGALRSLVAHSDQASRSARASLMDIHVALFPATRPVSVQ